MSDTTLQSAEELILTVLIVSYALTYAIGRLRRTRSGLDIWTPVAVGVTVRLLAGAAVNSSGVQSQLRGFDENTFLGYARAIAATPWGRGFLPHGHYQLQTEVFA